MESIDVLKKNLELAKEQLKIVDNDIKRITGRDPSDRRIGEANSKRIRARIAGVNQLRPDSSDKVDDAKILQDIKRPIDDDLRRSPYAWDPSGNIKTVPSSAAAIKKPQMEKRRLVDAKLEARAREEKENLRRERAELFRTRREHHVEVSILQQKMRLLKKFEIWKEQQEKMKGFCRTSKPPYIFYRPKIHNEESKWRIEVAVRAIDALIARRRKKLETEFEENLQARRRIASSNNDPSDNKVNKTEDSDKKNHDWDEHGKSDKQWSSLGDISSEAKFNSSRTSTNQHHGPSYNSPRLSNTFISKNSHNSHRQELEAGELSDGSETFALGDEPQLMEEDQHHAIYTESPNRAKKQNTSPLSSSKRSSSHLSSHSSPVRCQPPTQKP
ncbi:LOW QUALITY PROTEIN: pinn, putative [Schistosoma mansoni]|uniref:pinn, putative n=1 Tax=Schistosoma mansoni TaxID=6183 RepID=UPI00022C8144|nr:LOW QUALITY PROTEIN: pinn, putative [Schistosoma mansoni]|eukprot:XP_018645910.1 LOW QUALITY PROTEIN: pinn, putative [Schistosoma mansoni]